LRTATLNPALFLGLQASHGSVEAGKWAELVLLDANPLENIRNVRQIEAVVARDRIYERPHLAALVTSAEALAERWQTSCKLLWGLIRFTFSD
jgi:cytosine/adenosine deaminase-related metal-dependent hydrolase